MDKAILAVEADRASARAVTAEVVKAAASWVAAVTAEAVGRAQAVAVEVGRVVTWAAGGLWVVVIQAGLLTLPPHRCRQE